MSPGDDDLRGIQPDRTFDGGDLDCGSGLILLIRENMLQVPEGGILEMGSREPTVGDELPAWCRMAGHEYLGAVREAGKARYFLRRGSGAPDGTAALAGDMQRAKGYEWRLRARATGHLRSTVYTRNFSFDVGQPASFGEQDRHPSAVEYVLGALAASLTTAVATEAARDGLAVDDIEISVRGTLGNVLAILGLAEGDPGFKAIALKAFLSSTDDEARVRAAWDRAVARSPIVATLARAVDLDLKAVVL
jgi:TusA-related sulfurtransferase/uncharacterized OsmC-like protein